MAKAYCEDCGRVIDLTDDGKCEDCGKQIDNCRTDHFNERALLSCIGALLIGWGLPPSPNLFLMVIGGGLIFYVFSKIGP